MHIGLFDSGVGGLTVLKELRNELPGARLTYLGDTARLPYGNKAPETLKRYTQEILQFLDQQGVEAVVIACHSASSVSLDLKKTPAGAPIYNVIVPSCEQAVQSTKQNKVGVLATKATSKSGVYPSYIKGLNTNVEVFSQEAPLLVPLVEEGLIQDPITQLAIERYVSPLLDKGVDTLILGCTHYPILMEPLSQFCGPGVKLIDPALSVARQIKSSMNSSSHCETSLKIYLTDHSPHFIAHGKKLMGDLKTEPVFYPETPLASQKG